MNLHGSWYPFLLSAGIYSLGFREYVCFLGGPEIFLSMNKNIANTLVNIVITTSSVCIITVQNYFYRCSFINVRGTGTLSLQQKEKEKPISIQVSLVSCRSEFKIIKRLIFDLPNRIDAKFDFA